jgi:hypothetical protein
VLGSSQTKPNLFGGKNVEDWLEAAEKSVKISSRRFEKLEAEDSQRSSIKKPPLGPSRMQILDEENDEDDPYNDRTVHARKSVIPKTTTNNSRTGPNIGLVSFSMGNVTEWN